MDGVPFILDSEYHSRVAPLLGQGFMPNDAPILWSYRQSDAGQAEVENIAPGSHRIDAPLRLTQS
jgi:hypothetical protein